MQLLEKLEIGCDEVGPKRRQVETTILLPLHIYVMALSQQR